MFFFLENTLKMARGNQRDLARAKALKKHGDPNAGRKDDGLTRAQREERDAKIMTEKNAKKMAAKADGGAAGGAAEPAGGSKKPQKPKPKSKDAY